MKKLIRILFAITFSMSPVFMAVADDAFDLESFAVVDSTDPDINLPEHELNDDTSGAAVSTFDIAGAMLGMTFEDVQALFFGTGGLYTPRRQNSVIFTMHPDWKYNLDYECRQQGTVIPTELANCIQSMARARGLLYASELHLVRENTGETMVVYFTSNATDNKVWKIEYNNDVNELEGADPKFANQRQKKILMFWQNVLEKYGAPNSGTDKWVTSTNAYDPVMTAYYGKLVLTDEGRRANDEAENINKAREHFPVKPYAF